MLLLASTVALVSSQLIVEPVAEPPGVQVACWPSLPAVTYAGLDWPELSTLTMAIEALGGVGSVVSDREPWVVVYPAALDMVQVIPRVVPLDGAEKVTFVLVPLSVPVIVPLDSPTI